MIRKIIFIVCACVFVYSAVQLAIILYDYHKIEAETDALIAEYTSSPETIDDALQRKIDFDALLRRNPDVIGWLYIPDTNIDEPIFKGKDNDYYLHSSIDRQYNVAGQIFIDEINNSDFKDDNTIIYGHNMKNGSRFHNLRYFSKKDYFKEHSKIYIYLPDSTVNVYKTFSSSTIRADSDFYRKGIDYEEYVQKALSVGSVTSKVSSKQNPLILLSTCSSSNDANRYVVFARLDKNVKIDE